MPARPGSWGTNCDGQVVFILCGFSPCGFFFAPLRLCVQHFFFLRAIPFPQRQTRQSGRATHLISSIPNTPFPPVHLCCFQIQVHIHRGL